MSEIRVNTLKDKSGREAATLKAFCQLDQGTTLNESLNVSGIVDNGVGRYEATLSNAFTNANYALNVSAGATSGNCSVDDSHYEAGVMCVRLYRTDTSAYMESDYCVMQAAGTLA